jgi:hypothetical protein
MIKKLLVIILIVALVIVYVMIFVGQAPEGRPRNLTPAERQDSVTPGRRKGKG